MSAYRPGYNDVVSATVSLFFCLICGIPALAGNRGDAKSAADSGVAIQIVSNATDPIFPKEWATDTLMVKAIPLPPELADQSIKAVQQALAEYPTSFLRKNLHRVFIMNSLLVSYKDAKDVSYGARNWPPTESIYLAYSSNSWLATCLHHELAHILHENHPRNLSLDQWKQLNSSGFQYGNGSFEALRAGNNDIVMTDSWLQRGFVRSYATSEPEEDFACICEEVCSGDHDFWQAVDHYEALKKKVAMAIDFYHSLDAQFTEAFFRGIPGNTFGPYEPIPFPNGGYVYASGGPNHSVSPGGTAVYPPGGGYYQNPPPTKPSTDPNKPPQPFPGYIWIQWNGQWVLLPNDGTVTISSDGKVVITVPLAPPNKQ